MEHVLFVLFGIVFMALGAAMVFAVFISLYLRNLR
jgi:hypothetical protein